MSIGNNKGEGNKGRNFPYQHNVLKGLQGVLDNTGSLAGILNSILNATVAHQDMEILLVRDPNNGDIVIQQIREYDETTDTWSTSYTLVDGTPYVPSVESALEYLDPSAVLNLILTELLDQGIVLDNIKLDTANLDVALSSRLNTLGQKISDESAPVVLSTEQEAILQCVCDALSDPDAGGLFSIVTTEATLLAVRALLTTIATDLGLIYTNLQLKTILAAEMAANIDADTWDTTIGNTKTFTYYNGTQPGHPATTTTEVQTLVFSDGGGVVFTQTFTYDAANNVLTIVVT